jgi:hypothetical protein
MQLEAPFPSPRPSPPGRGRTLLWPSTVHQSVTHSSVGTSSPSPIGWERDGVRASGASAYLRPSRCCSKAATEEARRKEAQKAQDVGEFNELSLVMQTSESSRGANSGRSAPGFGNTSRREMSRGMNGRGIQYRFSTFIPLPLIPLPCLWFVVLGLRLRRAGLCRRTACCGAPQVPELWSRRRLAD